MEMCDIHLESPDRHGIPADGRSGLGPRILVIRRARLRK